MAREKLSDEKILKIRDLRKQGKGYEEIAELEGVSIGVVHKYAKMETDNNDILPALKGCSLCSQLLAALGAGFPIVLTRKTHTKVWGF